MANMEKTGEKMNVENVMHMLKTYKVSMEGGEISRHEKSLMHIPSLDTSFNSMEAKGQESHSLEAPPKSFNHHDLQEICQILSSPKAWISKDDDLQKCTLQFTSELAVEIMKNSSIHEIGNLLEARKCTEYLLKVGFSIPLSKSLYIRALCRAGRLEEALTAVNEVNEGRPTLEQYTYGSLVHALLQKGWVEEALATMGSMKQVGICPTFHVYTSLIVYFYKGKEIDKALEMFEKIVTPQLLLIQL